MRVGETFEQILQILGCELDNNARTRWGSHGAHPDPLAVIRVRGGSDVEEMVGNGEEEGKDVKG